MAFTPEMEEFLQKAAQMPAIPAVVTRLLAMLREPDRTADDISRTLATDTALTAKTLKLANSVFYSRMGNVSTLRQAVVTLGWKTVQSLVLAAWTMSLKKMARSRPVLVTLSSVLNHSLAAAVTSNLAAEKRRRADSEESFMAGLLHDLGRVAFITSIGESYEKLVIARSVQEGADLVLVEQEVFGFDHSMLGAELMRLWHFPEFLSDTALRHHDLVVDPSAGAVASAATLGDALATRMGHNIATETPRPGRDELRVYFGIDDIETFSQACEERMNVLLGVLSDGS